MRVSPTMSTCSSISTACALHECVRGRRGNEAEKRAGGLRISFANVIARLFEAKQGLRLAYDDGTACFPCCIECCIESTGLTSQPKRQILSRGTGNVALGFRANYCTLGMAAALSIILRHVSLQCKGYAMLFTAHLSFGGDALLWARESIDWAQMTKITSTTYNTTWHLKLLLLILFGPGRYANYGVVSQISQ